VGVGGVAFTAQGAAKIDSYQLFNSDDSAWFYGYGGRGSVVANGGSASVSLDVEFVAPDLLTGLTATIPPPIFGPEIDVIASTADGPVYGALPECAATDPSVQVIRSGAGNLEGPPQTAFIFSSPKHGTFTITCSLGTLRTIVLLPF
jgi:hypothetical protein